MKSNVLRALLTQGLHSSPGQVLTGLSLIPCPAQGVLLPSTPDRCLSTDARMVGVRVSTHPSYDKWDLHSSCKCPNPSKNLTLSSRFRKTMISLERDFRRKEKAFLLSFEQRAPHFHFALGLAKYVTGPGLSP